MRSKPYQFCMLALLGACVSATKHEDLKTKYDAARAQLEESRGHVQSLEQEIRERERQATQLAARVAECQQEIARLKSEQEHNSRLIAAQAAEGERLMGELAELLKDRSRLRESTDQLKAALVELSLRRAVAEQRVAEYRAFLTSFKNLIDAGTLRVRIVDGRMVLALPADVLFDSGSAKLSKTGKETIAQVGTVLAGMRDRRLQVEGHTDNVPIRNAPFASNWELAAARSMVVLRALMSAGVRSEALSAASYGEHLPAASNDSPEGRAENRRIEIVLPPDLSMLPGFEELTRLISKQ